ncbi:MAG: hypothetical protein ABSA97_07315 [Verrucomicrobiia bacterium]
MNAEKSLEWKVEEAARLWLLDKATHKVELGCDVRHYESDVSAENLDGTPKIPTVKLPCLILKAVRIKQFTPALNVHLLKLETHLWANADDTSEAAWQKLVGAREAILLWDALADELSGKVDDFFVHAILEFAQSDKMVVDRHWTHRFDIFIWAQPEDV